MRIHQQKQNGTWNFGIRSCFVVGSTDIYYTDGLESFLLMEYFPQKLGSICLTASRASFYLSIGFKMTTRPTRKLP